jgi:hypothetical protein
MVIGINITFILGLILELIIKQLKSKNIPTIVYTNLLSLYKYLVRLGTTKEKRLIIDIIALRQSYKYKEIFEIR